MIEGIRKYIEDHHDEFGIRRGDVGRLSFMEIDATRRIRTEKSVYEVAIDGKPLLIVKSFPGAQSDDSLTREYANLSAFGRLGLSDLIPSSALVKIRGKSVMIEKYLSGVTIQEVLKKKPFITRPFMRDFTNRVFSLITRTHTKLNSVSARADKGELRKDIDLLVTEYCRISKSGNPEKIRKIADDFIERYPEDRICSRIVLFDAFPSNMLFDLESDKAYLIDLEYAGFSTLIFLEPIRGAFFYLKQILEYANILCFIGSKEFGGVFFGGKGWLGNLVAGFLEESIGTGSVRNYDLRRGLMGIFLMAEAVQQQKIVPGLPREENIYVILVDLLVRSDTEAALLAALKLNRVVVRRGIVKKVFGYITRGEFRKVFNKIRAKYIAITS
jgi:hypothetical protein